MITRSNYEIYFIDHFDGKLDKERQAELFSFLGRNPDLKEEFELFPDLRTDPDLKVGYRSKDRLKKNIITNFNYKTWFVRYFENDLSSEQKNEVEQFIKKDPALIAELESFRQTRLIPDKKIIFKDKRSIRRGNKIIVFAPAVKRILSIAAALVVIMLAYFLIQQLKTPSSEMAGRNEKKVILVSPQSKGQINNPMETSTDIPASVQNKIIAQTERSDNRLHSIIVKSIKEKAKDPIAVQQNKMENNTSEENIVNRPIAVENETKDSLASDQEISQDTHFPSENNGVNVSVNKMNFHATIATINFPKLNMSDIFSDDEMSELNKNKNNNEKIERSNASTLLDLAAKKLLRIARSADVLADKRTDDEKNTVTYAVAIGKNFSISHTTSK